MSFVMFRFSFPVEQGVHPETGAAVFGFEHEGMFIVDPFLSDCGRFTADPVEAYGVPTHEARSLVALNKALEAATEAAVNAACKSFQDAAGIASGDFAGAYFSDTSSSRGFSKAVADYIQAELVHAGNTVS